MSEDAGTEPGSVGWTYTLNNAAAQYLGANDSVTEVYTVTVTDEAGASATQDVTITIQGTNDGVTITSGVQADTVVERNRPERRRHGARSTTSTWPTCTRRRSRRRLAATRWAPRAGGGERGRWHRAGLGGLDLHVNNAAAQYLARQDSVTEVYTVTVTDEAGASATQDVTITIQGTNDGPTITSGVQADTVVEETDLSAAGTVAFNDIDVVDVHTAAFAQTAGSNTLGASRAGRGRARDARTEPGSVGWTYTVNNAAAQYLGANDSVTEVYTVTVTDEAGASATQDVTITITGHQRRGDDHQRRAGRHGGRGNRPERRRHDRVQRHRPDRRAHGGVRADGSAATRWAAAGDGRGERKHAGTEPGTVGWTYTVDNAAAQYLGADDQRDRGLHRHGRPTRPGRAPRRT